MTTLQNKKKEMGEKMKTERYVSFGGGRGRVKTAESEHLERNPHLSPKIEKTEKGSSFYKRGEHSNLSR